MPRRPHIRDADLDKATARTIRFEGADGAKLADAPPFCPRCGCVWHRVDEGYGCVICGRRWRAEECLRELARFDRHNDR